MNCMSVVYVAALVRVMVKTGYDNRSNRYEMKSLQLVESESDHNSDNKNVPDLLAVGDW